MGPALWSEQSSIVPSVCTKVGLWLGSVADRENKGGVNARTNTCAVMEDITFISKDYRQYGGQLPNISHWKHSVPTI